MTEVQDTAEIFQTNDERNPPTPYFLVYVNDEMKDRLADPVCREIVKDQAPPAGGFFTEWDSAAPAEGSTAPTSDMGMDPPPYGEAWGGSDAPGMGGNSTTTTTTIAQGTRDGG